MGFRLIPKSVTLNDLERHNGCYLAFFAKRGSLGADYVEVVEEINRNSTCLPRTVNIIAAL